jgi:putative ABC transport system permease protein
MWWMILANVRKRRARAIMTVAGVAIGVGTLFALLAVGAGIESALKREIEGLGAHILVLPKGCPYALSLALMQGAEALEHIPQNMLSKIAGAENVHLAVPVVVGRVQLDGEQVPVYGATDELFALKRWTGAGFSGAVVGSEVATRLRLVPGQTISLDLYETVTVEVAHVLPRSGGRDDTFVFVPLHTAQTLLALPERLSAVLVQTTDVARTAQTRVVLGRMADVQAVPPSDVFDMLVTLFGSIKSTLILVTGIAIVVGVLTTMNTMTMAAYERRRDIGLLRAVGATRLDVFRMFMAESLVVSLVSGVLGVAVGYAATHLLPQTTGFGLQSSPTFSLGYVALSLAVAAGVGSVSGIYPALLAARTQPIKALREL